MIKARIHRSPFSDKIEVAVFHQQPGRLTAVAEPITWREVPDGEMVLDPTFAIDPDEAQLFMDSLWDAGVRPSQAKGSAGQLTATERHLADMRALVFDRNELLKIAAAPLFKP